MHPKYEKLKRKKIHYIVLFSEYNLIKMCERKQMKYEKVKR
jgi:hypothetical protein